MDVIGITIGKPIVNKAVPTNAYVVDVTFMHGDAAAYTVESYNFKFNDPQLLTVLTAFTDVPDDLYSYSDWRKYLQQSGWEQSAVDNVTDMLISDITNDQFCAQISGLTITYYDHIGAAREAYPITNQ